MPGNQSDLNHFMSRSDNFFTNQRPLPKDVDDIQTILKSQQNMKFQTTPAPVMLRRPLPLPGINLVASRSTDGNNVPGPVSGLRSVSYDSFRMHTANDHTAFFKKTRPLKNELGKPHLDAIAEPEEENQPPSSRVNKKVSKKKSGNTPLSPRRPVQAMLLRSSSSFIEDYLDSYPSRPPTPREGQARPNMNRALTSMSLDTFSRPSHGTRDLKLRPPYPPNNPCRKTNKGAFRIRRENSYVKPLQEKYVHKLPPMPEPEADSSDRPSAPTPQLHRDDSIKYLD